MKKIKPYVYIASIAVLLLFLKFTFLPAEKSKAAVPGKNGKKTGSSPVTVFIAGAINLEDKLYASGTIAANEAAELKVEANGNITYLNLPEGQSVQKGTLLLKVNDAELQAQLDKVKVDLKLAFEVERRQHQLLEVGGISRQEYDMVLAKFNSLKADSAYYQAQIAKTEIHAPFNGILGIRKISAGSYITSAISVTHIYQMDRVKIEFSLPEKYTALFRPGDVIHFSTEGSTVIHKAKIIVRDPQVDLESRSVHYLASSSNPKGVLFPGAFAHIELHLQSKEDALFVPTESIVPVLKGKKIFVIKNGKAQEQPVKTGLRTEEYVQILSGLSSGDSVIVNGNYQLKQGAAVNVQSDKTKKTVL